MSEIANDDKNELSNMDWTLNTIPEELFLHICSFLPSKFIIDVLTKVCSKFKNIFSDNATWKIRLRDRFPKQYLLVDYCDANWSEVCIAREEQYRLWHEKNSNMAKLHIRGAHDAAVDVVHIIQDGSLCASGSRDRDIKLWNLNVENEGDIDNYHNQLQLSHAVSAHAGWIWAMAYSPHKNILYSGSWDGSIKSWAVENLSEEFMSFQVKSPVLCLAFSEEILVCGCYYKTVSGFDPKTGTNPVFRHRKHQKSVLCLAANDKFIISGSEDHSLIVYNKVAQKIQKTLTFEDSYPYSISLDEYCLWVGDSKGYLHLINLQQDEFNLIRSYPSGHSGRITGIHHSFGSIITSSSDKSIKVLAPCTDFHPITTISCKSVVAGLSAFNDTLASANIDESITIWKPKIET